MPHYVRIKIKSDFRIIFFLVTPKPDILFTAILPLPKGIGKLVFGNGLNDP
jgi:hypothetical protein